VSIFHRNTIRVCNFRSFTKYLHEQAYAKIDNQQIPEALELVTKALQADSNFAMAHHIAGSISRSLKQFDKLKSQITNDGMFPFMRLLT